MRRATRYMALDTITWTEQQVSVSLGPVTDGKTLIASLVWNAHVYGLSVDRSDLDLYLLRDGAELAWSRSAIDNVEHLYVKNLPAGVYELRVSYAGHVLTDVEAFALSYRVFTEYAAPDFDQDGDVDSADLDQFEACASGPGIAFATDCDAKDLDHDADVDQSDFALFQRCYSGESNAADPGLANRDRPGRAAVRCCCLTVNSSRCNSPVTANLYV